MVNGFPVSTSSSAASASSIVHASILSISRSTTIADTIMPCFAASSVLPPMSTAQSS